MVESWSRVAQGHCPVTNNHTSSHCDRSLMGVHAAGNINAGGTGFKVQAHDPRLRPVNTTSLAVC